MKRSRWVRVLAVMAAAVMVAGLAAACDEDDEDVEDVDPNGETITIGVANERPYGYVDDGEVTGEAPELAKVIFDEMGFDEVDFEVTDFDGLIGGLNAGRFDVIAAGMFITDERAESVLFADPDYCAATAFAVPEGNPDDLSDFESVAEAGIELGVLSGAVEPDYATESGVSGDQLTTLPGVPDLFDALDAGRVDAVALTSITVREQVEDLTGFESTEAFVPVIDGEEQLGCGAFAFRFEDQDLRDEFNDILTEMKDNDEILPIIEEFGFTEVEVDAAKGVTVEDLVGNDNGNGNGNGNGNDNGNENGNDNGT